MPKFREVEQEALGELSEERKAAAKEMIKTRFLELEQSRTTTERLETQYQQMLDRDIEELINVVD